jgi:tripartite-type tricarboxylate transporter receptor subunit TctC
MKFQRRQFLQLAAGAAALPTASRIARAQAYPTRPITLVHGFPPGGPVDVLSRILAEALSKRLGQSVIVDAKSGATGTTAAGQLARAKPDGYSLMTVPATFVATAAMFRTLPYRPIEDFSFISTTAEYPLLIVTNSEHRIRTLADLIMQAQSEQIRLRYGTAGVGSLQHLTMEFFAKTANLKLQHIPYRGGAPAITDLLGKRVDIVIDPPTALVPFIHEGRLRALAVTGNARFSGLPNVPSVAESGFPGFAVTAYQGIAGPAGLTDAMVQRLNTELASVLAEPTVVEQLGKIGNEPRASSPDEFRRRVAADIEKWKLVIKDAEIERI